jgi:hypothetical protein
MQKVIKVNYSQREDVSEWGGGEKKVMRKRRRWDNEKDDDDVHIRHGNESVERE